MSETPPSRIVLGRRRARALKTSLAVSAVAAFAVAGAIARSTHPAKAPAASASPGGSEPLTTPPSLTSEVADNGFFDGGGSVAPPSGQPQEQTSTS